VAPLREGRAPNPDLVEAFTDAAQAAGLSLDGDPGTIASGLDGQAMSAAAEGRELPPPSQPMAVARAFTEAHHTHEFGALLLRHWRGGWWRWQTTHWAEVEHRAVREVAYRFTENAYFIMRAKDRPVAVPWNPNRH
jgi:hypothetical protein